MEDKKYVWSKIALFMAALICEAYNCIYCKDSSCTADSVLINSHFSSCETFKCK